MDSGLVHARLLTPLIALLLGACTIHGGPWLSDVAPSKSGFPAFGHPRQPVLAEGGMQPTSVGYASVGSGQFTRAVASAAEEPTASGEAGITLNLVNASIAQAAKTVLGDLLGRNFLVDPRVQGTITLQTTSPVSKAALIDIFETALRSQGAAIVEQDGFDRVVPLEDARARMPAPGDDIREVRPGLAVQVVPLNYVSAEEMRGILEPIAPSGGVLRVDTARNLIVIAGTSAELSAIRETIALFDVDWMRGMSFSLYPLRTADPESVVAELESIFQSNGAASTMVRFIPNKRLNSVLVIANRPRLLQEAEAWIDRLDSASNPRANRLVVYPTKNRRPSDLAPIIRQVFARSGARTESAAGIVAPSLQPVEATSAATNTEDDVVAGPATETGAGTFAATTSTEAVGGPVDAGPAAFTIVPDDADGSLLVYATAEQHDRVRSLLEQIDRMPKQVLLEATVAEVALTDELKFGLRWFFERGNFSGRFTDTLGALGGVVPGFSFLYTASDLRVALTALANVTDVKVVSSPTLMVIDNEEARLQVGDEVPTVTQTAQSVTDPDAPIVNAVTLRDTGVILRVRPHINEGGRVMLDIEQEVSDVVPTTTSGIDSPTIRQRRIATTVVIGDGESLALGGLIQERNTQSRAKVPVLGDVPVLGSAFRRKEDAVLRTELIVFIRPRIVYDVEEARRITDEYRSQLTIRRPEDRSPAEIMRNDIGREFN